MSATRDALIGYLVAVKLEVRRVLRQWRPTARGRLNALRKGILDDRDAPPVPARKRPGARLPARPVDASPRGVVPLLFLLALAVRTWRITEPPSVVFDELHFGKFVKAYWAGTFYFDIHPPLGKLNLYAVSRMFASAPPAANFSHIGEPYNPGVDASYVPMRLSSAFFGASVPPMTYMIARELGLSFPASVLPAVSQTLDSLVIIESRLILMDAQLECFMAACLLCALRLWGAPKGSSRRRVYLVLTSVTGALALSVKWTSLATPALVALISLTGGVFPSQGPLHIFEMLLAGAIAVLVYAFFFYIHFSLLPLSGDGDRFMLNSFQVTLPGNPKYNASAPKPAFLSSFMYLNSRMLSASAGIKTRHKWESKWYQWIISHRGVLYHYKLVSGMRPAKIYLVANLAVVYSVLLAVLGFMGYLVLLALRKYRCPSARYGKEIAFVSRGGFLFSGYVCNLLPYMLVSRCTFLYHYVPALFYGELLLGHSVNALPLLTQRKVVLTLSLLILAVFAYWSPWIYAYPISRAGQDARAFYGMSWN